MVGAPISFSGNQEQSPSAPGTNPPGNYSGASGKYAPPPPQVYATPNAPISTLLPYNGQAPPPSTTASSYPAPYPNINSPPYMSTSLAHPSTNYPPTSFYSNPPTSATSLAPSCTNYPPTSFSQNLPLSTTYPPILDASMPPPFPPFSAPARDPYPPTSTSPSPYSLYPPISSPLTPNTYPPISMGQNQIPHAYPPTGYPQQTNNPQAPAGYPQGQPGGTYPPPTQAPYSTGNYPTPPPNIGIYPTRPSTGGF